MSLKSRKAKHRAFRDALRERKRLRKQRREAQDGPFAPPHPSADSGRIAQPPPAQVEVKVALEEATAALVVAAECYEQAKRRKRGKVETEKLYIAHMVKRGYSETEARMALAAGEAARA